MIGDDFEPIRRADKARRKREMIFLTILGVLLLLAACIDGVLPL